MNAIQQAAANDPRAAGVFRELQSAAKAATRDGGRPVGTQEYLVRHALESFLDRLSQTPHGDDFVLKGGILLAAYGIRRPTKDVDAEAISTELSAANLTRVVTDVAAVQAADGVAFDLESITVDEIREDAEYTGLRLKVVTYVATAKVVVAWDVSAGDPIVPEARMLKVPRILGSPVELYGYAPETIVAEKGVTILQRGTTSTRWRDYVDIVQVARQYDLDHDRLVESVRAVAKFRGVDLEPAAPLVVGYGDLSQAKWQAWRSKAGVEAMSETSLDDQMREVCVVIDPVFLAAAGT
ncbi:nucleotidyl transferase AbiEii/AbiGii toxin family protein [Nocardioides deserti]|uniref:Nucleotidyl transferase AbiEii/AbiGii toxin family protein n=1 Tax=Nocardioides deserti TaxID=1588644 RepID=A0ABR6U4M7_9ACTN|nr:nucleotidyl transferase AbiEii/AbiGii toxin family protein [Nocardioides deserti]MBC2959391.1 nucleotidyl transferase AbiEii/AbiGii toxin family protein [Nocardioides deserti]GGO73371.1 hypothetical protein GCM10012276_18790 [Nocardioides deserti]